MVLTVLHYHSIEAKYLRNKTFSFHNTTPDVLLIITNGENKELVISWWHCYIGIFQWFRTCINPQHRGI